MVFINAPNAILELFLLFLQETLPVCITFVYARANYFLGNGKNKQIFAFEKALYSRQLQCHSDTIALIPYNIATSSDFAETGTGNSQYPASGIANFSLVSESQLVHQIFMMTLIPSTQIDFTASSTANQKMKEPANFQLHKITVFI